MAVIFDSPSLRSALRMANAMIRDADTAELDLSPTERRALREHGRLVLQQCQRWLGRVPL